MIKSIVGIMLLSVMLFGCGSSSSPSSFALSRVTVSPSSASVAPGTTRQFTAVGTYNNGNQVDITTAVVWKSSDPNVATVSNEAGTQGVATAVGPGTATITAITAGFSGSATLTTAAIQSISVAAPTGVPIIAGSTNQQFTATATLTNGQTQDITNTATFGSSDQTVASFGATNGQANFLAPGPTNITATSGGVTGTLPVTVLTMNNMNLSPSPASVGLGGTLPFTATGTLSNGTTAPVTSLVGFTSSNPAIATIGANGALSAVGVGATVVTSSFPGVPSQTSNVTVMAPNSITVAGASSAVPGSTQPFTATGNFTNGSTTNLTPLATFSSSNPAVATVNNQGVVTAVGNGTTVISATAGGVTGSSTLTVNSLSSLAITPPTPAVGIGSSVQLSAIGTFSDGTTQDVTNLADWRSSAPGVATVSNVSGSKGLVSGVSRGSTVITATFNGLPSTATVGVQQSVVVATNEAFVTGFTSNFLNVIDVGSNIVISNIPVGSGPAGVAINQATNLVYVANNSNASVSVVDSTSNAVIDTISVQGGAWGVAVDPTTNRIYVANSQAGTVSVIDGTTDNVTTTITVGAGPRNLAVNPAVNRLYVANFTSNTVSVINTATNAVIATVSVGAGPVDLAVSPTGSLVYVANSFGNTISVINTASNAVLSSINLGAAGSNPQGIAVSPALNQAYVSLASSNNVAVIDTTTNNIIATIPLTAPGASPKGIAVRSGTNRIYVANSGANSVSVIDPLSRAVIATIPGIIGAFDVAVR